MILDDKIETNSMMLKKQEMNRPNYTNKKRITHNICEIYNNELKTPMYIYSIYLIEITNQPGKKLKEYKQRYTYIYIL